MLAATDDKAVRLMISKEVLPTLIELANNKFNEQLPQLKKRLVIYSKHKDTANMSKKYFQTAAEEVDIKLKKNGDYPAENNEEEADHERTEQDEIFNHVMVEEGYNTHSPLEDKIKQNGKHNVINLENEEDEEEDEEEIEVEEEEEDEDFEGFVDPYENMSEEEVMARMPPYFNKSFKQKKKFFVKLNQNYLSKLRNPKKGEAGDKPRVNFDFKKNAIKKFKKHAKVCV